MSSAARDPRLLVPHAGAMCLLARIVRANEREIVCAATSHRASDNPLRRAGRLAALHLAEYGAQAMAVHGGLADPTAKQRGGMLVAIRDLTLEVDRLDDIAGELTISATKLIANAGGQIAVSINQRREGDLRAAHGSLNGHTSGTQFDGVLETLGVRRLTPGECSVLQGYPRDYTLVPYGKKGRLAKDGPRYRAIGNAFPVPVIRWLGERIELVEEIIQAQKG